MLFVGATARIEQRLRRLGVMSRVTFMEPTADEGLLAAFYASADVVVSASAVGESFGVAIAEAMALGIPVVTTSTPEVDNAQVEIVDPGVTGYVASHPETFAAAVATLLLDSETRRRFGLAAAEKAARLWEVNVLTRQLESLYLALIETGKAPDEWTPDAPDLEDFAVEYLHRSKAEFASLSGRQHLGVRLTNMRWRGALALESRFNQLRAT